MGMVISRCIRLKSCCAEGELRRSIAVSTRIGLRTVELRRKHDRWGRSFTFVGQRRAHLRQRRGLDSGGFLPYPHHRSTIGASRLSRAPPRISTCCAYGAAVSYEEAKPSTTCAIATALLVWQDFMFACSVYPLNDPMPMCRMCMKR